MSHNESSQNKKSVDYIDICPRTPYKIVNHNGYNMIISAVTLHKSHDQTSLSQSAKQAK